MEKIFLWAGTFLTYLGSVRIEDPVVDESTCVKKKVDTLRREEATFQSESLFHVKNEAWWNSIEQFVHAFSSYFMHL